DLNAQRAAHLRQETVIQQLKETLNQLINPATDGAGSAMTTAYDVVDSIPIQTELTLESIRSGLTEQSPLLQLTRKNIDIAHITLEEIKADHYPVLEFNAYYNFSRVNNDIALNPVL